MGKHARILLLPALALLVFGTPPLGAAEDGAVGDLAVERLRLDLGSGSVRLCLRVSAPEIPAWFLVGDDEVAVTVDGTTVFALSEAGGPSAKSRFKGAWRWRFRGAGPEAPRLKLHLVKGTLELRVRVLVLPDVGSGPLELLLRLGEREFRATVLVERKGNRVRSRPAAEPVPGETLPARALGSNQYWGLDAAFESLVFRDAGSFLAWWPPEGRGPSPAVDFETEIAVVVILGDRPHGGHSIELLSAERRGEGALVRYRERRAGWGCMTTQAVTSPWFAIAIPKVAGDVAFLGRIALHRCR